MYVDRERLKKDSAFFRRYIDEQEFYEFEIDDFEADTVGIFLTLLADREINDIQDAKFRELHKMSVVFEVVWLREECCSWLCSKISKSMGDDDKLFVFEECLFILRKWDDCKMMDLLIAEIAAVDNTSFITRYFQEFEKLDTVQLDLMLKLGGSNTELFLQTILQNLVGKTELGANVKCLLQNMNLALCSEINNELYSEVFDTVSRLPEISIEDVKFALQLTSQTARLVASRDKTRSVNRTRSRVLYDEDIKMDLRLGCQTLDDITDAVRNGKVESIFVAADLLLWVCYNNTPNSEEIRTFLSTLSDLCCTKKIMKVSHQYLDMIVTALKDSTLPQKRFLVQTLKELKRNEKLSTYNGHVVATTIDNIKCSKTIIFHRTVSYDRACKHLFIFKHPCNPNCDISETECGFVLGSRKLGNIWRVELLVNEVDYEGTGIHFHDCIFPGDLHVYQPYTNVAYKVSKPGTGWDWFWLDKWLPASTKVTETDVLLFVEVNIQDYLVIPP